MMQYDITAPDGRKFRVTAPDEATQEQVLAYTQQQFASMSPKESARDRLKRENPAEYDPDSPQFKAKYGAAAVGGVENFFAGAGKATVDLGRGLKQLGLEARDALRGPTIADVVQGSTASERYRRELDRIAEQDADLVNTGAGTAGQIAGTLATTLLPGTAVARGAKALNLARTARVAGGFVNPSSVLSGAASGATLGALQPVGSQGSRVENIAGGALLGGASQGVINTLGRIAQPVRKALSAQDQAAVDVLKRAGVELDTAQLTGSKLLDRVKTSLDTNPLFAGAQATKRATQSEQFTRAALRSIGEDAPAATRAVMARANSRIGKVFEDVAARNPVRYDNGLESQLDDIIRRAFAELESGPMGVIRNQTDEILKKAADGNGVISGKAFQQLKRSLDNVSKNQSAGHFAREMREALLDGLGRSANADDVAAYAAARQQWGNLKTLEGAIDKKGGGAISPARLANALATKANRFRSVYGRGDQSLVELAQAGNRLLTESVPNSGTPARVAAALLPGAALGVGSGVYTGDWNTAAQLAAGGFLAPKALQTLLNNPAAARYLSEGLGSNAARRALTSPQTPLLRQLPVVSGLFYPQSAGQ